MCIILDANRMGDFLNPANEDLKPVRKWFYNENAANKFAYSPQLFDEYAKSSDMVKLISTSLKKGKMKRYEYDPQKHAAQIRGIKSKNDMHILKLAAASKAKVLITNDKALQQEYKSMPLRGRVYKNETHSHLLESVKCP